MRGETCGRCNYPEEVKSRQNYMGDVLDVDTLEEDTRPRVSTGKKIWAYYIRAQKKDHLGIPLVRDGDEIFSDYYEYYQRAQKRN